MMSVFVLSCLTFINSLRCELVLVLSLFVCILLCIVFWYSYFFLFFFFFFSSRRRHTRYIGDWSSDVCSSDLVVSRAPCLSNSSTNLSRIGGSSPESVESLPPPSVMIGSFSCFGSAFGANSPWASSTRLPTDRKSVV